MIFYTGIREVEIVNTAAVVAVAVAVVSTLVAVAVIALIAIIYWWKKVNSFMTVASNTTQVKIWYLNIVFSQYCAYAVS